ncbi:tetraspanin Tsp2 [Cryptococcus deuterogattii LA55]|nr:tetraspanin Tsp2 [Cryptococcus deuterogattii LA55]KIR95329.1 tetraspanin Tsp2 [Cryptococcus deuterogattii CBS 10090]
MPSDAPRRFRFANLASKLNPQTDPQRRSSHSGSLLSPLDPNSPQSGSKENYYGRPSSPTYSDQMSSNNHGQPQEVSCRIDDDLVPPVAPFVPQVDSSLSSRRSSISFLGDKDSLKNRASSLSLNYVPAKFTRLHAPGDYAHRRKQGGGRDAFASDAQRMGQVGTVDDDEGVIFQVSESGLKKKKPKLRWNRFKWVLFFATSVLFIYGMATLVCAILVWLNIFYQSDVIRVGNRTELIISTVAAAMILFTSLLGFAGIFLNNRTFLAVFTLLLWVDFGLLVAPGYITYKRKTFNLEGKINSQWSRDLGTEGRLRIQDALRCCGYYSPFVEATVSPLCYSRSNFPGCKSQYLHLERRVLGIWFTVSFAIVPAHILIILAALLCSNHVTYRFGKGLMPERYRLDLGSMAVIMDEYAGQIAAQYGPTVAQEAMERSSINLATPTPCRSEYDVSLLSVPNSRRGSSSNLEAMRRGALPGSTRGVSLYDPSNPRSSMDLRPESSLGGHTPGASGNVRYLETETTTGSGAGNHSGGHQASESVVSFNDDHRHR